MRINAPIYTVDWYYTESNKAIPQTETQEMLESGKTKLIKLRIVAKKQLGLKSYGSNDFRLESVNFEHAKIQPLTTSYKRDYTATFASVCPPKQYGEYIPDYLLNRKPVNDFGKERLAASEFMFMDDHFVNITQARLKINMQRQLRNQHYPLV